VLAECAVHLQLPYIWGFISVFGPYIIVDNTLHNLCLIVTIYFSAAIPLVDSDFNLLPVHFVVDPGLSWNGIDCFDDEDLDALLKQYLDVQLIAIPGAEASCAESDSHVNGDVPAPTSVAVPKADSWNELTHAASDDSEDTGCANFIIMHRERRRGSTKERKGNGATDSEAGSKSSTLSRAKLPVTMQSMARSFGSLGRSFRRLRKNITRIARRGTLKCIDKPASISTSIEHSHVVANYLTNQNCILCAGLLHRRQPYQEEMVRNYLVSAAERFKCECEKQQTALIDRLNTSSVHYASAVNKTSCVNTGCEGVGDSSTAYLCATCFEHQQREEIGSAMPSHVVAPSGSVVGVATRVPVVPSSIAQMCSVEPESIHAAVNGSSANCYSMLSSSAAVVRLKPNTALDSELDELQRSAEQLPSLLTKSLTLRAE